MADVCVEDARRNQLLGVPVLSNSRLMDLRRRFLSRPSPNHNKVSKIRKNLFGAINHAENLRFVHEELEKISRADCERWNFDFQNEQPQEGRYAWEPVKTGVPEAYRIPRLDDPDNNTTANPHTSAAYITTCPANTTCSTTSSSGVTCTPVVVPSAAAVQNKSVKRLKKKSQGKVASKLCTDYFKEVKPRQPNTCKANRSDTNNTCNNVIDVNKKLTEVLQIRHTCMSQSCDSKVEQEMRFT